MVKHNTTPASIRPASGLIIISSPSHLVIQGLTGSVALTPVSGSSVSITLPTGARLGQQTIRGQRVTLTPQQQQQQLRLMMLKQQQQQQRAQLQQQIQVLTYVRMFVFACL